MLYFGMLIGHLMGDFMFQTDAMAMQKAKSSKWCMIHSIEYTICVTLAIMFRGYLSLWIPIIVFISHYPIDRYSVGRWWCENYKKMDCSGFSGPIPIIICIVVDNTIHLVLMTIAFRFMELF